MPTYYQDPAALAQAIVAQVGKKIVLALPLGLGKANHVVNALFARAIADPTINLQIFTALTLEKPRPSGELEKRFMGPIIQRVLGGYPELAYCAALRHATLPPNIVVNEFFLLAGRWLAVPQAQQNYICVNYTHALRGIIERGVNVVGQLVAKRVTKGVSDTQTRFSLSCNTDLTLDLLAARAAGKADFLLVGQVNSQLPFMGHQADLPDSAFSHVLDSPATDFPLFAPLKEPVSQEDYAIGLHVARLVPDGGTLQIGIGSMGDAVAQGLILRQRENAAFRAATQQLATQPLPAGLTCDSAFAAGLFGSSEMLVDSFLALMDAGVLTREVDGAVLHGGFFLGPNSFYQALREMPEAQRDKIQMRAISYVNELYGDEEGAKRRARVGGRFINSAMMATLMGAIVSDGLADGRVVSGVGGQYNFVAQAFALEDARAIIMLRATRQNAGKTVSNIVWSYGHTTIPRHLRDIVVTEYGVADLRGKADHDVIAAMLAVTDSRFQAELLTQAKKAGKIAPAYEIPRAFADNTPQRIESGLAPLRARGHIPPFPFGTDLTETEQQLMPALHQLQQAAHSPAQLLRLLARAAAQKTVSQKTRASLSRMGLDQPSGFKQKFYAALLRGVLADR